MRMMTNEKKQAIAKVRATRNRRSGPKRRERGNMRRRRGRRRNERNRRKTCKRTVVSKMGCCLWVLFALCCLESFFILLGCCLCSVINCWLRRLYMPIALSSASSSAAVRAYAWQRNIPSIVFQVGLRCALS